MLLKPIGNDGAIAGTGTLTLDGKILGAVLITADGTNNAVVVVRTADANGKKIVNVTTKTPLWIKGPISNGISSTVYYDVSGTGAAAQFFEWVE